MITDTVDFEKLLRDKFGNSLVPDDIEDTL